MSKAIATGRPVGSANRNPSVTSGVRGAETRTSNHLSGVVNDTLVVLVASMAEVHAHDIDTSATELCKLLNGVDFGPDGSDNASLRRK